MPHKYTPKHMHSTSWPVVLQAFFRQTVNKRHFSETPHNPKQTLQILLPLKAAETRHAANTSAIPQTHNNKLKEQEKGGEREREE